MIEDSVFVYWSCTSKAAEYDLTECTADITLTTYSIGQEFNSRAMLRTHSICNRCMATELARAADEFTTL